MRRGVPEEEAVARMLERGARPLEPFPGTQRPWRCECLTCGAECHPRYNDVVNKGGGVCSRTCRSRKLRASIAERADGAVARMRANGWEPLEPYPGAGKPWRSRCLACGEEYIKRLAHVQEGRGGCRSCLGMAVAPGEAAALMRAADLEPLVPYPGGLVPWLSRCTRCGEVGSPAYSKVKARGHQCWGCRGEKIGGSLRLDEVEAEKSMLAQGLRPLGPYPGSVEALWRAECMICGAVVSPRLHNIRAGQGGCTRCAVRGMNMTEVGYLYIVIHDGHKALKVGIANIEQRLVQHVSQGWRLHSRWDFDRAQTAREVEEQVLRWIRGAGIPYGVPAESMKYRGYTETAPLDRLSADSVRDYINTLLTKANLST